MLIISAGGNGTDLGEVGRATTILGAKRVGRRAVREMLYDEEGTYTMRDAEGREVLRGERSIRTGYAWWER